MGGKVSLRGVKILDCNVAEQNSKCMNFSQKISVIFCVEVYDKLDTIPVPADKLSIFQFIGPFVIHTKYCAGLFESLSGLYSNHFVKRGGKSKKKPQI